MHINRKTYFIFNLKRICILLTVTFLVSWITSKTYCRDTGFKYISNYNPKEYNRQPLNWCVLQDIRGIIYVGNNNDLLEFDGISWRIIDIPNNSVRSMAMDDHGNIYIGGKNEFGVLAPGSNGTLKYVSLCDRLEDSKKNFSTVWQTHSTKEGIYFRTSSLLFRRDPGSRQIKTWTAPDKFTASYAGEGKYFIQDKAAGLMHMENNALAPVPGGGLWKGEKIYMTAPFGNGHKILIGTRTKGFYIYDGNRGRPFPIKANKYLEEKELYHGIRLSSGDFALATRRGGLLIIDSQGELKEIFDKGCGLQDDSVKYVYEDFQGHLWLALDKGISKIEYVSPISIYDDRSGLPGNVLSVVRHHNHLYAGTTRGLYLLTSGNRFRPVSGISSSCYALLSINDSLLAAATDGVFQVGSENNTRLITQSSYVLLQSHKEKERTWVGTRRGLISLLSTGSKNRQWAGEHRFENITQEIRTIVEDINGNLWLGTQTGGVFKIDFPVGGTILHPRVTGYNERHHLPAGEIRVFKAAGHVMFAGQNGIYRFDELKKVFIPDTTLGETFAGGSRGVFRIVQDQNKNIWLHSLSRNFQAKPGPDRSFVLYEKPFLRLPDAQVNTIYPDGDITWFAGHDGLIRYDTKVKKNYRYNFPTLVRKVVINGNLFFDGYRDKKDSEGENLFPVIEYRDRNLRFEFAAPFFEEESKTQYRCFLEGYNEDWSAWTPDTNMDYTNLDPGLYTFKVQAGNVYKHPGEQAVFQFEILPPWYNTWWAFTVYIIAGLLSVFLVVRWRSGKLAREKQRLEQIVKQRTKEIEEKNQQLETQTLRLKEQSEKLAEMDKVKSRFFANISHEFRTPLTLIMGPLEQMLSGSRGKGQQKKLSMMLRNSQRLLSLINQLLKLSKFDSGKMKLQACPQNIIPFLKSIKASFESMAGQKELDLTFRAEEENMTLYFDPQKFEEVIYNLLSNAVKFTPPRGKVAVSISRDPAGDENFPSGSVTISVCDTGPGIPGDQLAHVFDRFYQSGSTYEHHRKGSGIGLAIAKEVAALHHGKIAVHSREGTNSGTEFIIRLPMGAAHLEPDEIVEEAPGIPAGPGFEPADSGEDNAADAAGVEKDSEPTAGGKNIILVVEDNPDVRDYIRDALEPVYTAADARNGREGIQKALELIPDLIISDVMMPGVDGYELCRVLKKDIKTSHIPIILLTARASEESIIRGLETGADDYITKPFNTKILGIRIKNLIDLRCQLQQKIQRQMMLQPSEISVSSIDQAFIKELQDMIEANLADPLFSVEQLGKKLYMSRASLYRKIFALTGESPRDFIRSYRLKRGAQLLEANFGNVTEVAFEVGFSSSAYFTKCFKEKFHQLPHTYRASH